MKKGKITITIIIGIMCFILTALIFLQVKTISQTNISELELMRESELKTEITSLKTKFEETVKKVTETNNKILEYEEASNEGKEASELLQQELKETEELLGKTSVTGEGIIIKLANGGEQQVNAEDLLELINLLKNAGAEAISINDQRIVANSSIICDGSVIRINGEKVGAPFTIKAIGLPEMLKNTYRNGGYLWMLKYNYSLQVDFKTSDNVIIPKYTGTYSFDYAQNTNDK